MKNIILVILVMLVSLGYIFAKEDKSNKMITIDYVPDAETAKKVAEAIWLPIYGNKIYSEKPYVVSLKGDSVWVVTGSISKNKTGGVAYIEIRKSDCKILKVIHGK